MAKNNTLFGTKTPEKPYPLGLHIPVGVVNGTIQILKCFKIWPLLQLLGEIK